MYHAKTKRLCIAFAFICLLFSSGPAFAAPVTAETAASAVRGWLHQDHRPLGRQLSAKIKGTKTVKDATGGTVYYVVQLEPSGFVILSADDLAEPVIAFSATGNFDGSSANPLAAVVNRDLPVRMAKARAGAPTASGLEARAKWRAFLAGSDNPPPDVEENQSIVVASQIWVAPFVQTLWAQQNDISGNFACYNYYVPPGPNGDTNNDPCGCVATALAQEMFYFQYPNTGVDRELLHYEQWHGAHDLVAGREWSRWRLPVEPDAFVTRFANLGPSHGNWRIDS